ncbi:MAG: ATP-binding protein, partial [Bacteroidetes bacterium]|nr:ATP-binding protein [Bacteroidota bacterium]
IRNLKVSGMKKRDQRPGFLVAVEKWCEKKNMEFLEKLAKEMSRDLYFSDFGKIFGNLIIAIKRSSYSGIDSNDMIYLCMEWLFGQHLNASEKKILKVRENITKHNARKLISALAKTIIKIGYKGWLLIVDEQEAMSTLLTPYQQKHAQSNLRMIIDRKSELGSLMWVFGSTPEFFSEEGVGQYQALKDRITDAIILETDILCLEEYEEISRKLFEIYRIAYPEWNPPSIQNVLSKSAEIAHQDFPGKPRLLVSSLVNSFDMLKERTANDFESAFNTSLAKAYEQWMTKKRGE